ncbi:MAG: heavy metal-associated domain-containing protein [Lentimicrobiaceae bacterium]|nr:heavy metal-associated domain-containing protein [Lentimicrobiaceae bacterium]
MKNTLVLILMLALSASLYAQQPKTQVVNIKVSSQCEDCKETIERALAFERGITKSIVDLKTNSVEVTYKTAKTNPDKIRKAIADAGYDADEVKANPEAYKALKDCCKKPEDRELDHSGHNH